MKEIDGMFNDQTDYTYTRLLLDFLYYKEEIDIGLIEKDVAG